MHTGNLYGNMSATLPGQMIHPNQMYHQMQGPDIHHEHNNPAVDSLADSFGNFNLRNATLMSQAKAGGAQMSMNDVNVNPMMGTQASGLQLMQLPDGTFMYSGSNNNTPGSYHPYPNAYNMASTQSSQYQQAAYPGISNGPHTPRNNAWLPSQGLQQVPELVAPRRSSWSSNEEQSPQTPLDVYQQSVMVSGQSPSTWSTTPSPMQAQFQFAKAPNGEYVVKDFWALTQQAPAIPPPVPAIHSGQDGGRGSLDKILDNRNGTTNVYIRGLQPNTTDAMLEGYGRRFGAIASQKAIIEMSTNACKGYGFIMYHNYDDAENCIRAFYYLGYEAKFAKESHNQRLKALSDRNNTNLYVSNLPRLMVEKGLETLFEEVFPLDNFPEYKPTSSKILKDNNGISRGVGFARFRTPEICQQIIDAFNNKTIGEGKTATTLQLRYADTEEQKKLKTFTAEKRQFKTNEYNEVVYGPNSPWRRFYSPVSASTSYYSPSQARVSGSAVPWSAQSQASISPPYVGYPQSVANNGFYASDLLPNSNIKPENGVPAAPARHATHITIESPSVTAAAKKAAAEKVENEGHDVESSGASDEETLVAKSKSSKSHSGEVVLSPSKSKL